MKCIACNRPLTRAAGMVGKLPIGPKCLRKITAVGRKARVTRSDQPELFDQIGAAE